MGKHERTAEEQRECNDQLISLCLPCTAPIYPHSSFCFT